MMNSPRYDWIGVSGYPIRSMHRERTMQSQWSQLWWIWSSIDEVVMLASWVWLVRLHQDANLEIFSRPFCSIFSLVSPFFSACTASMVFPSASQRLKRSIQRFSAIFNDIIRSKSPCSCNSGTHHGRWCNGILHNFRHLGPSVHMFNFSYLHTWRG